MKKYKIKLDAFKIGFLTGVLEQFIKNSDINHGTDIAESLIEELTALISKEIK